MLTGDTHGHLLGRAAELIAVRAALAAEHGVVVLGEAGVGKTALLGAALDESRVRTGRCFRSLSAASGAPLQQALDSPLPVGDPAWTAHWLVERLRRRTLHLDDLQWADELTLATVALLAGRVPLAITVRSGDPGTAAALEAVSGLPRIQLQALDAATARGLAMRLHPQLRPEEADEVAERCGGNPLLIEELGAEREPRASLQSSLVRRLRRMGAQPWTGFALLALAGEPVPADWVPAIALLRADGLVVDDGGLARPRHPLLADSVVASLADDDAERRRVYRLLADTAHRGGADAIAAAAYAAAGDRSEALRLARQAAPVAARAGDRAALLRLAADCAEGAEADELAIAAVHELVAVGEYDAANTLVARPPEQQSASWLSLVGRICWQTGDDAGALLAFERARELVEPDTRESIRLMCEHARAIALASGDVDDALRLARRAHLAAVATTHERARALAVLGTVEHLAGEQDDIAHLTEAVDLCAADPDADLQVAFSTANNLVAALEGNGQLADAIHRAGQGADRADALRLRGWAQQMRAMGLNARMHLGDYGPIAKSAPALLAEVADLRTADQLHVTLGLALVDLGRIDDATRRIESALHTSAYDQLGRGNLLWVLSEARLWSGDFAGAFELAEQSLGALSGALALFPLSTLAHAELRLGRPVQTRPRMDTDLLVLAGVPGELAGLAALSAGDATAAADSFTEAALLWRGRHRRGEFRCRWLAADVMPDAAEGSRLLVELEDELAADGWAPLLSLVRRSLRARGVRRSAPRGRAGELTLREREVLDLIAQGLSTDAVAGRLGVSRATVATLVSSARARLGASTRWQAVGER